MAATQPTALVIVESPTKAKTIRKYLGSNYVVEASMGHVRDLASSASEIPAEHKKKPWARLAVDVENGFKPIYVVPSEKKKVVSELKKALKGADVLYLATDEDREGEAIGWHLLEVLKPKVPVHRLVFHEITEKAIKGALETPRELDIGLVTAQETRRVLDRLVGYEVSPLLWRKIARGLSAGRVQSVAVRLLVIRERERSEFVGSDWWNLKARLVTGKTGFDASMVKYG
ncbi:MAG: toprim domain-containing protein, partial [Bradymonadia bacterium]